MSEEFGPDFITVVDEDGTEIELEHLDTIEWNGNRYMAFFPATPLEGEPAEEEEQGLILLKVIVEDGEELLSTMDDDEELEAVYEQFMAILFEGDEE